MSDNEAVEVLLAAEKILHEGFVAAYEEWKKRCEEYPEWARQHPFTFTTSGL